MGGVKRLVDSKNDKKIFKTNVSQPEKESSEGVFALLSAISREGSDTYRFKLKDPVKADAKEDENRFQNLMRFSNHLKNKVLIIRTDEKGLYRKYVTRMIRETNAHCISVSTNARFADNYDNAESFISNLYMAFKFNIYGSSMQGSSTVKEVHDDNIFRLLVFLDTCRDDDEYLNQICNIIAVFKNKFSNFYDFQLRLHVVEAGKSYELDNLVKHFKSKFKVCYENVNQITYGTNGNIVSLPRDATLYLGDGYSIEIGLSGVISVKDFYAKIDEEAKHSLIYAFPEIITFGKCTTVDFMTILPPAKF